MDQSAPEDAYDDSNSLDNDIDAMEAEDEDEEEDDVESPDNELVDDSPEEEDVEEDSAGGNSDSDLCASSDPVSANDVDTSDLSENEYDRRMDMCAKEAKKIEEYFYLLREAHRYEKLCYFEELQIDLEEETAPEFNQPLEELSEKRDERVQIAGEMRKYRLHFAQLHHDADLDILEQDFKNEKTLLKDNIKEALEESIRKLDEEFNKADNDFIHESTSMSAFKQRKRKNSLYDETYGEGKRPRKPVSVSGPYIVYMLKEDEINEDLIYMSSFSRPHKAYHRRSYHNYGY